MNQSQFQQAAGVSAGLASRWFPHIDAAMKEFGIVKPEDQAMFIAQSGHESAGFSALVESFNYTPAALLTTFGGRITNYQAYMLGRDKEKGQVSLLTLKQLHLAISSVVTPLLTALAPAFFVTPTPKNHSLVSIPPNAPGECWWILRPLNCCRSALALNSLGLRPQFPEVIYA
ncbi:hypothetical protein [Citrobacter youngae]